MPVDVIDNTGRNILIDNLKAIGIFLMVAAHVGIFCQNFIYVFHMPLFFILSGMCYKYGKSQFDTFVIKKIKHLYLPYLIVNICWYAYEDISYAIKNGISAVDWLTVFQQFRNVFLFTGDVTILTIPTWFFKTLFWAIILYDLLNRFLHTKIIGENRVAMIRFIILIALLLFGWVEKIWLDDYWGNIFCSMILLDIGQYIKRFVEAHKKLSEKNNKLWAVALISSFLILLKMSDRRIELSQNEIVNPIFFVCGAIVGFAFLYSIYELAIARCKQLQTVLSYIGKNSVWIVTLHLFAFRIVALIQIKCYGLPITEINQMFRPITAPYWWMMYVVVGIAVPLLVKGCFDLLRGKCKLLMKIK